MDAVELLKIEKRIHDSYKVSCRKCPFSSFNNSKNVACETFRRSYPEEYMNAVEKWAEEHPIKTKKGKFRELFKPDTLDKWHRDCKWKCDTSAPPCEECAWWDEEYKGE